MNRFLHTLYPLALAAGLAGMAGAGFAAARHHPVALAMTLLIAAFFALGVLELRAFRRASAGLTAALAAEPAEAWLGGVPAALRGAVQQRLEGLRVALPGLALAPALAGLLVLLGMLGTFTGLVLTLGGTAAALNATADLGALRAALGAPVQGLGLAFSASVAGVTASATLGLMVALARRERAAVVQQFDTALLGPLRPLTAAHRQALDRQAAEAAARQAQLELVAQLQQVNQQMADQQARAHERLQAEQARFHAEAQAAYQALAARVGDSLHGALADSARLAGEALRPAAEAIMAGIAREAAALHERVGSQVATQLAAVSQRFETGAAQIAAEAAAAAQAQAQGWATQAQALLARLGEAEAHQRDAQDQQHAAARQLLADLAERSQQAAAQQAQHWTGQARGLLDTLAQAQAAQQAAQAAQDEQRRAEARAELAALAREREAAQQQLAASGAQAQQTLAQLGSRFAEQTQALVAAVTEAQARLQATQAAGDAERLAAWRTALQSAGAEQLARQQQLADGLLAHTRDLVSQAEAQARHTLKEAGALLQAAGEAPRAAVEVVAALREQLAQSQAQDQAALAERAELMRTVTALLGTLQQAAGEQRAAIDALVAQAATQLDGTGHTLAEAAVQLSASAAEMGSLGEGFGAAVAQFQGSNAQLVQHLAALEERLAGAMARSDEQLGYYVAQAREVIDLCLGSQKQVLDALGAVNG